MVGELEKGYREELRVVLIPDGSKRSKSRKAPGYESELTRDAGTGDLTGPTVSRAPDRIRDKDLAEAIGFVEQSRLDPRFKAFLIDIAYMGWDWYQTPEGRQAINGGAAKAWGATKRGASRVRELARGLRDGSLLKTSFELQEEQAALEAARAAGTDLEPGAEPPIELTADELREQTEVLDGLQALLDHKRDQLARARIVEREPESGELPEAQERPALTDRLEPVTQRDVPETLPQPVPEPVERGDRG